MKYIFFVIILIAVPIGTGCILPMEPSFSDPSQNTPPYLYEANPPVGSYFLVNTSTNTSMIEVTLGDQNIADSLFARWIFDFPEAENSTSKPNLSMENTLPSNGKAVRDPIRFSVACSPSDRSTPIEHRLLLAVADRPFLISNSSNFPASLNAPAPPGFLLELSWNFTRACTYE